MTTAYPSHFLCASSHLQTSTKIAVRSRSPFIQRFQVSFSYLANPYDVWKIKHFKLITSENYICVASANHNHHCLVAGTSQSSNSPSGSLSIKGNGIFHKSRVNISCAVNMAAGQSGEPEKLNLDHLIKKAKKVWDGAPQPVKSFPWNRTLGNFAQLILDLVVTVVKYLCVPLLFVSSLSEMSYCAHQRRLFLVPFPLLIGLAVGGVLKETALELSPLLKDAEVPWHLIVIALLSSLIKYPGPYYPYWGRIFIPHFANGILWSMLWFALTWYRRPRTTSGATLHKDPVNSNDVENE